MSKPTVAIIAAGSMGAGLAHRLTSSGITVLTNLDNRSPSSYERAQAAGMENMSLEHIAGHASLVFSVLPPTSALAFAESFRQVYDKNGGTDVVFVDCNAVSPTTVRTIKAVFDGSPIRFIDAAIIGGPPMGSYDPILYASAGKEDKGILEQLEELGEWGLKIKVLRGEGAGIGDASALKMSYAGIAKGITGLCTTMILAAHAASPATSQALLSELSSSQPAILKRITSAVPDMIPKAYRWAGEMEEISSFVEGGLTHTGQEDKTAGDNNRALGGKHEGLLHLGLASLFERVAKSDNEDYGDVKVLMDFVEHAKKSIN